jgi:hypothetical protein
MRYIYDFSVKRSHTRYLKEHVHKIHALYAEIEKAQVAFVEAQIKDSQESMLVELMVLAKAISVFEDRA